MTRPLVRTASLLLLSTTLLSCRRGDEGVRADPAKACPCPSTSTTVAAPPPPSPHPPAIPLDLPSGDAALATILHVGLDASGDLTLEGKRISDTDLDVEARKAVAASPDARVVLAASADVRHGRVISVLDLLKSAGITKIGFAVDKTGGAGAP